MIVVNTAFSIDLMALPPELQDYIAVEHGDDATLAMLALTCKAYNSSLFSDNLIFIFILLILQEL